MLKEGTEEVDFSLYSSGCYSPFGTSASLPGTLSGKREGGSREGTKNGRLAVFAPSGGHPVDNR